MHEKDNYLKTAELSTEPVSYTHLDVYKRQVAIWKMLRKKGCVPSALTQNVKDFLASPEIENIFENSDFLVLDVYKRQAPSNAPTSSALRRGRAGRRRRR